MKTLIAALIVARCLSMPLMAPCATEDSTMCYWDASARGNGAGTSFIAVTDSLVIKLK